MAKRQTIDFTDDDSGISLDRGQTSTSSIDLYSSTSTLVDSIRSTTSPRPTIVQHRIQSEPVVKIISDGVSERIRPITMKNSTNGDYIICRTDRGSYVAYRNPIVPDWVTHLVEEIERIQR